jgi:3-oxoacyl-[acyl-carrier protein] reductase
LKSTEKESSRVMRFLNKVAIITGGASGIGAATARKMAKEGAKLVLADLHPGNLAKMETEMKKEGSPCLTLKVNVADEAQVREMIDRTRDHFGGIDMLVNNAGISPKHEGKKQTLWEMSIAEWDQVMAVNIRGAFICSRFAVPEMIKRGGGAIVNLSSQAAKAGSLITGGHYVISKAGVVGLTKILAREVAEYGIRVNAVAPGRIDTPMIWDVPPEVNEQVRKNIPLKRLGKPEEVAEGILFLLSASSSFITGFVMDINGGSGMYY